MKKEQLDFIFNQHGGKEKVITEMYFEIFFDNPRNFSLSYDMTKEEKLEAIKFDDEHEMVIIKETNTLFINSNDYTPSNTVTYICYDDIQGITILDGLTYQS